METALVTGGTGFIGRHLVKRLLAQGRRVLVTGREPAPDGSEFLAANFQEVSYKALDGVSAVFHLAAQANTRAPDAEQWRVNCEDAADFLLMCKESGVERVVYASSCAVYGRAPVPFVEKIDGLEPLNAYGAAKLALDKLVSKWAVGIRPSNVFGPGEEAKPAGASMASEIVRKVRDGDLLVLFNNCSRDLVAVDDVADAFAVADRFAPGVYNVGSGLPVEYLSVALEAARLAGTVAAVDRVPCPFPTEFQEYTCQHTTKVSKAFAALGLEWNPRPWRVALAVYMGAGWPR